MLNNEDHHAITLVMVRKQDNEYLEYLEEYELDEQHSEDIPSS